jgi:hypothetical protein
MLPNSERRETHVEEEKACSQWTAEPIKIAIFDPRSGPDPGSLLEYRRRPPRAVSRFGDRDLRSWTGRESGIDQARQKEEIHHLKREALRSDPGRSPVLSGSLLQEKAQVPGLSFLPMVRRIALQHLPRNEEIVMQTQPQSF